MFSLLQFQTTFFILSQTRRTDYSSLYPFMQLKTEHAHPISVCFSVNKLVVIHSEVYSFRSHVFCWELQDTIVGQIFKYHCTASTEEKNTYILTIDEPNFSMECLILLSFTLNYTCRICWAYCNPSVFTTKRRGPSHGIGSSSMLCFLFITSTPEI